MKTKKLYYDLLGEIMLIHNTGYKVISKALSSPWRTATSIIVKQVWNHQNFGVTKKELERTVWLSYRRHCRVKGVQWSVWHLQQDIQMTETIWKIILWCGITKAKLFRQTLKQSQSSPCCYSSLYSEERRWQHRGIGHFLAVGMGILVWFKRRWNNACQMQNLVPGWEDGSPLSAQPKIVKTVWVAFGLLSEII